jgi:hypothetical protein
MIVAVIMSVIVVMGVVVIVVFARAMVVAGVRIGRRSLTLVLAAGDEGDAGQQGYEPQYHPITAHSFEAPFQVDTCHSTIGNRARKPDGVMSAG